MNSNGQYVVWVGVQNAQNIIRNRLVWQDLSQTHHSTNSCKRMSEWSMIGMMTFRYVSCVGLQSIAFWRCVVTQIAFHWFHSYFLAPWYTRLNRWPSLQWRWNHSFLGDPSSYPLNTCLGHLLCWVGIYLNIFSRYTHIEISAVRLTCNTVKRS